MEGLERAAKNLLVVSEQWDCSELPGFQAKEISDEPGEEMEAVAEVFDQDDAFVGPSSWASA